MGCSRTRHWRLGRCLRWGQPQELAVGRPGAVLQAPAQLWLRRLRPLLLLCLRQDACTCWRHLLLGSRPGLLLSTTGARSSWPLDGRCQGGCLRGRLLLGALHCRPRDGIGQGRSLGHGL